MAEPAARPKVASEDWLAPAAELPSLPRADLKASLALKRPARRHLTCGGDKFVFSHRAESVLDLEGSL